MRPHLWEIKHDYYCNDNNFYAPGNDQPVGRYNSWADFTKEEGGAQLDLNLVFRWDWIEGAFNGAIEYNGDDYYRNGKLLIFIMGQRKGLYRWASVQVCRADEPPVIEYLQTRWKYLFELWEPIA